MATLVDSYSESNRNSDEQISDGIGRVKEVGQAFTGVAGVLNSAVFYLKAFGDISGNAYARVYAHTGTFGSTGTPTGSVLATSNALDISTLSTSTQELITFTFSGAEKITLVEGTKYFITFYNLNGDSSHLVFCARDSTSPTHAGNGALYIASWAASANDYIFYVYIDDAAGGSKRGMLGVGG